MRRRLLTIALAALLLATVVGGARCPFSRYHPKDYTDVRISPVEKYVAEEIAFKIKDVSKEGEEFPAVNRLIQVYLLVDEEITSEYNIYTDADGEAVFMPEESGKYGIATSGRYIFFQVLSRCGDGRCNAGEDRVSCPSDCAECGDGVCDVNEDKTNCPKDCIVCGDGSCDAGESRNSCPNDCATCGDGICDSNENKETCPEDCVVCGDGVCDILELVSLHNTTCAEDCIQCGDGFCDYPEDFATCPGDCIECGDNICSQGENETCPEDCTHCGDGVCELNENKSNCIGDCGICGDGVCDSNELVSLHQTDCPEDCLVCGDGVCDPGESGKCKQDCERGIQSFFMGYLLIPLIIAAIIVVFEITRHYLGKHEPKAAKAQEVPATKGGVKFKEMEPRRVIPYLGMFVVTLVVATAMLAFLGLSYEKTLSVFDIGSYLLGNMAFMCIAIVALGAGIGILARATYFMRTDQSMALIVGFTLLGMLPGFAFFQNPTYVVPVIGMTVGAALATFTVKREEKELAVRKPFKIGSDAADKMLFIAAVSVCIMVFFQLYLAHDTNEMLAKSVWESPTARSIIRENIGGQPSEIELRRNVVDPFFESNIGGANGKLIFAMAISLLFLAIAKVFTIIVRLLAGFFSWILDKSGLV